ncbi:putative f-box domain protein [Mycena venus]|uniref:Putative f-box domain protein n=1 Tax=Mycena venus TaxID=2733690 RepID=A0A8H6XIQ7_9AGAR|nr:putative f-box domain protein [Mycena venus]
MRKAQDRVISTPELLELILSYLPMRHLLLTAPLPDPTAADPVQNPLLVELFPPFFAPEVEGHTHDSASIRSMPWSKAPAAYRRKEASWRRMLVTQPPAKTMIIAETHCRLCGGSERRAVLKDIFLTMGVLYDLVVSFICQSQIASSFAISFAIRWHNGLAFEADLTLAVTYMKQCKAPLAGRKALHKKFYSAGANPIEIDFGGWVTL